MYKKYGDRMENSVDTDQTPPESTMFAQTCLSKKLGLLRYTFCLIIAEKKSMDSVPAFLETSQQA